jgi:competence protein ComEA
LWEICEQRRLQYEKSKVLIFVVPHGIDITTHQQHYAKGDPMKIFHLLLVALFTCTLSLAASADKGYAASATKEGTAVTDTASTAKKAAGAKKEIPRDVNINTADKELLIQIPGIGPVTADSIIKYRNDNGQFKSLDELTSVKGIGDKTLAKIKPYLQKI